ncbi:hypothetical protein WA171_002315 [Blastocystis sp. BT1]
MISFLLLVLTLLLSIGNSKFVSCGSKTNVMTVGVYNSFSCNSVCSRFSTTPALSTDIHFANDTIYGTPVETSSLITYTIDCSGDYGIFSLGVLGYPTELSAGFSEQTVFIGLPFIPIRFTGNTVFTEYSITPAVTNGLEFDESTGRLSGVYTGSVGRRSFEVTGKNQYGSVSTVITLNFQLPSKAMIPGLVACYYSSVSIGIPYDEDWFYSIWENPVPI